MPYPADCSVDEFWHVPHFEKVRAWLFHVHMSMTMKPP